jgi:hypothetical protein
VATWFGLSIGRFDGEFAPDRSFSGTAFEPSGGTDELLADALGETLGLDVGLGDGVTVLGVGELLVTIGVVVGVVWLEPQAVNPTRTDPIKAEIKDFSMIYDETKKRV